MKTLLTLFAAAGLAGAALAAENWTKPQQEVADVFIAWAAAIKAGDIDGELSLTASAFTAWDFMKPAPQDRAAYRQSGVELNKKLKAVECDLPVISIIIEDNLAVAHGRYKETLQTAAGDRMTVQGPWTSTLVRQNGKWLVLGLSFVEDRPVPVAEAKPVGLTPAASPEMQKLAVWHGNWTSVGEYHATPLGPAGKFTGTLSGRPILDGAAAEFVTRERSASGELEGRELCWFDPAAKKFAYVFLGSDGYFEQGSFTMTGELCAWECTGVAAGTPFRSRGTETVSPDRQILARRAELSLDGKTWLPFFVAKFTKVAPN